MIIIPDGLSYDKKVRTGSLSVINVAFTSVRNNWIHKERFLYANEFILVTDGTVHIKADGRVYDIEKNEFLILPQFSVLSGDRPSESSCAFYSVTFEGNIDVLNKKERIKQRLSGNIVFIYDLMKKLWTRYRPEVRDNAELDALFLTLAYELRVAADCMTDAGVPMQKMLDYIHDHINSPVDISDLCGEFNYSPDYISKMFSKTYGITVKKYINQVKMAAAKQLLVTSHLSVEQVGSAVGFDNVHLFYKYFRYHEKITPSEYRKLNR